MQDTVDHFRSSADAAIPIQRQFAHWLAVPVFPDARPFLHAMQSMLVPVCVLSDIDRRDIEAAIALHDLRFHGLVNSDDVKAYKPHPEMFHLGLDLLALPASDVLHVGDSRSSDVAGLVRRRFRSHGSTARVVQINGSSKLDEEPIPDHLVTGLTEVVTIITSM